MKLKLDANKLREKVKKENEGKSRKKDSRFLNYYDLDFGQKMVIRLLPANEDNELYVRYDTHGPNFRDRRVSAIRCTYEANGESCPACSKSFGYYNDGDKDNAGKWRSKTSYIGQCLVMESDIEVPDNEDGNIVKMVHLPHNVVKEIKKAIENEMIDNPLEHDFVLRKTKNDGGRAAYDQSSFKGKVDPLSDEILELFEKDEATLYDLDKEIPEVVDAEAIKEWISKTEDALNEDQPSNNSSGGESSSGASEGGEATQSDGGGSSSRNTLVDKLKQRR